MNHREHLYLAWRLLRQHDPETALRLVQEAIRTYAAGHGYAALYNEDLTRHWVERIMQAVAQHPDLNDFDLFLAACPELLERKHG